MKKVGPNIARISRINFTIEVVASCFTQTIVEVFWRTVLSRRENVNMKENWITIYKENLFRFFFYPGIEGCLEMKCGSPVHIVILIFQINVYPQIQQVPILEGEESDGDVPRLGKSSTLTISLASFYLCKKGPFPIDIHLAFAAFFKKSPKHTYLTLFQ